MTVAEFAGCTFLAFGTPLAMFLFTIMHDPIRIIVMIAAAFVWLIAMLISSLAWFCLSPLGPPTFVGVVCSVAIQEIFRFGIYKILRRAERFLHEVADESAVIDNKHILAYVTGFGFGLMSGALAMANVLADATGPGTTGLFGGSDIFFVTSAAQTLCMILLHTCWAVIFFAACDTQDWRRLGFVVVAHLGVSLLTLLNRWELYAATLTPSYAVLLISAGVALQAAGGSVESCKRFVKCQ